MKKIEKKSKNKYKMNLFFSFIGAFFWTHYIIHYIFLLLLEFEHLYAASHIHIPCFHCICGHFEKYKRDIQRFDSLSCFFFNFFSFFFVFVLFLFRRWFCCFTAIVSFQSIWLGNHILCVLYFFFLFSDEKLCLLPAPIFNEMNIFSNSHKMSWNSQTFQITAYSYSFIYLFGNVFKKTKKRYFFIKYKSLLTLTLNYIVENL